MTTKYDIDQRVRLYNGKGVGIIREILIYSEDTMLYRIHELDTNTMHWYCEENIKDL